MPIAPARILLITACALSLLGCAHPASPPLLTSPPTPIAQALAGSGWTDQAVALAAYPLDHPEKGVYWRSDVPMQPASTMKVVTAAVALDRLGPASQGWTELRIEGAPQGGVLKGPLFLRGGGDTALDWGALWTLLSQLRARGIDTLDDGVVVDRTLFQPARMELGVPPFDDAPEFDYNVIPDALDFNQHLLLIQLQSDAQTLRASVWPPLPGVHFDARSVTLIDAPCEDWDAQWRTPVAHTDGQGEVTLVLQGSFPRDCTQRNGLNLVDSQWLVDSAVRLLWHELGGHWGTTATVREGRTPEDTQVVALHQDAALADVLRNTLKRSDNILARLVFLRLGRQQIDLEALRRPAPAALSPDTREAAGRAVRAWMQAQDIPTDGLVLENGSGLSRAERITPATMARLLAAVDRAPYAPELRSGLPLAGVDGTLRRRFQNQPAQGRARLKSGTLSNVVAVAGYVRDRAERDWVVVAMVNQPDASSHGTQVVDRLVNWVAEQR